jgi:hypothetical protein
MFDRIKHRLRPSRECHAIVAKSSQIAGYAVRSKVLGRPDQLPVICVAAMGTLGFCVKVCCPRIWRQRKG